LADYVKLPGVYAAGRLDRDSEGLLLLSDDGKLINRISDPRHALSKRYLVQVEGLPTTAQLERLRAGVVLNDGPTRSAQVEHLADAPAWLWPRQPPIRFRAQIPSAWLAIHISEGRNRQVPPTSLGGMGR